MRSLFVFIFTLVVADCVAQDSTLSEIKNPSYLKQREAIFKSFRPRRDSLIKSQPPWKDSVAKYLHPTNDLERFKLRIYQDSVAGQKEQIRLIWCPYSDKLITLNKKYLVVGDMKAHCFYVYDNK